eukprot:4927998-Amphidinium_carterae.6
MAGYHQNGPWLVQRVDAATRSDQLFTSSLTSLQTSAGEWYVKLMSIPEAVRSSKGERTCHPMRTYVMSNAPAGPPTVARAAC